jgi:AcrR family transcriptional regulator
MKRSATPAGDGNEAARPRRRYDSPVRREQAAQTRDRILAAGSTLVHGFETWDWRDLTFRAVAEQAGVGVRTVYRYFPTERDLHDAVMLHLREENGVTYDGMDLDGVTDVAERSFASLASYAVPRWTDANPEQPTLIAEDRHRRDALLTAVTREAGDWSDEQRQVAAAMLDVLWAVPSYERLLTMWNFDAERSMKAINWSIHVMIDAIRDGRRPD